MALGVGVIAGVRDGLAPEDSVDVGEAVSVADALDSVDVGVRLGDGVGETVTVVDGVCVTDGVGVDDTVWGTGVVDAVDEGDADELRALSAVKEALTEPVDVTDAKAEVPDDAVALDTVGRAEREVDTLDVELAELVDASDTEAGCVAAVLAELERTGARLGEPAALSVAWLEARVEAEADFDAVGDTL